MVTAWRYSSWVDLVQLETLWVMVPRIWISFFFPICVGYRIHYATSRHFAKIFGHHNHQLTSWDPGQGNRVPGFEFSFASQSDLRGIAQKTPLSIRL